MTKKQRGVGKKEQYDLGKNKLAWAHCVGFIFFGLVHMLFCTAATVTSSLWLKGKVSKVFFWLMLTCKVANLEMFLFQEAICVNLSESMETKRQQLPALAFTIHQSSDLL